MEQTYDFSGWATRNDLKCTDGRTIRKDAFKHCDGKRVPLVWNHQHDENFNVLGHAILENRNEGVYAYCKFNDTESGKNAKSLVEHGDVTALSIYANKLKQQGGNVLHGEIRELSLVLAGANPGAYIDSIIMHGEESDEDAIIYTGEEITLFHADEQQTEPKEEKMNEYNEMMHADGEETIGDIFDTFTEKQRKAVDIVIGMALEDAGITDEGDEEMKQNAFENDGYYQEDVLTHADMAIILENAKHSSVGSFKKAYTEYLGDMGIGEEVLAHGIDEIETLFPEYELLKKGEPETLERDQSWISAALGKIHKSPYSRIRTRHADARIAELRAKGYQKKGDQKTVNANIKLLSRTTDPQTIYVRDNMHRDDIIDITDFDVVAYQWKMMRHNLDEEIALAVLIGDGREEGDPDKIHETHLRSIWNDDELYTIHTDVDIAAAKAELQGTNTSANFGENYIYAEAIITAALYSREKYKGTGKPDLYCTPHLVNIMLLARDLNGRRIYDSISDLAAALNVGAIHTVEQFEGKQRTTEEGETKKLLGLFVNLADYQLGSTKGGEVTKFEDFDIDFNQHKFLLETRLSGALTKVYSAIALEEPVRA